jgi:hypothetical protein
MKKLVVFLGIVFLVSSTVISGVALADSGFAIGPAELAISVPVDGSSTSNVYITSYIDGTLIVGKENLPFRVEPETISISADDREKRVELLIYGNPTLEEGEYKGKLTFRTDSDTNVSYGIKIRATITQTGSTTIAEGELAELDGQVAEVSFMETVKDNLLTVILGALVLVLLAIFIGIFIGRRQRSGA